MYFGMDENHVALLTRARRQPSHIATIDCTLANQYEQEAPNAPIETHGRQVENTLINQSYSQIYQQNQQLQLQEKMHNYLKPSQQFDANETPTLSPQ